MTAGKDDMSEPVAWLGEDGIPVAVVHLDGITFPGDGIDASDYSALSDE
jgi:hypothetical protein